MLLKAVACWFEADPDGQFWEVTTIAYFPAISGHPSWLFGLLKLSTNLKIFRQPKKVCLRLLTLINPNRFSFIKRYPNPLSYKYNYSLGSLN